MGVLSQRSRARCSCRACSCCFWAARLARRWAARFAAVYGILGTLLIPLNYFVIELFQGRAVHPDNLERGSLGSGMGWPFLLGNLTLFVAFVYCVLLRWEVEARRARLALRADALAVGPAR